MTWSSATEFLAMGGYAGYVWGSFGAVAAGLGIEYVLVAHRRACALRNLRRQAQVERPDRARQ